MSTRHLGFSKLLRFAPAVAAVTAASYVLGFAVVNRHLVRFGYSSFDLLRPSYIAAGLWAIGPILFALVFTGSTTTIEDRLPAAGHSVLHRSLAGLSRTGIVILSVVIMSVGLIGFQIFSGVPPDNLFRGMVAAGAVVACALLGYRGALTPSTREGRAVARRVLGSVALSLLPFAAWAYLSYAAAIYSQVPFYLGGGRPRSVVVTVDSTQVSRAQLSSVSITPDSIWRVQALLLLRTEEGIVVAPKQRLAAVELPAKTVRLIAFSRTRVTSGSQFADLLENFGAEFWDPDTLAGSPAHK